MKRNISRILSAVIVAAMVFAVLPVGVVTIAGAEGAYVRTNCDDVHLFHSPGTSNFDVTIPTPGTVLELKGTEVYKGATWYNVVYPKSATNRKDRTGYVKGASVDVMTAEEVAAYQAGNAPAATQTAAAPTTAPTTAPAGTSSGTVYGWTIATDVHLRKAPGSSDYIGSVFPMGTVGEIIGSQVVKGNTWYTVIMTRQGSTSGRKDTGYMRQDVFRPMTDAEVAAWKSGSTSDPVTPSSPSVGTASNAAGKVVRESVYFRRTPEVKSDNIIELLKVGTSVDILEIPSVIDESHWYKARYNNQIGYIMSPYISVTSSSPTASPETTIENGTAKTIKPGVNLRLTAGGSGNIILQIPKNVDLPVKAAIVKTAGYSWYYVEYNGVRGYVRGDCVQYTPPAAGAVTAAPETVVTAPPAASQGGYVKTIKANVNVRNKPMGSSLTQIGKNLIMPMLAVPVKNGGYTWYLVRTSKGVQGYIRGDCVMECDSNGNKPSSGTSVVNPSTGTVTGKYIKITKANTNVRKAPAGEQIGVVQKGSVLPLGNVNAFSAGGYTWFYVNDAKTTGYIRTDCCFMLSDEQAREYESGQLSSSATAAPSTSGGTTPTTINVVITTEVGVNLRSSPTKDSDVKYNVKKGTVMSFTETRKVGGNTWYHVSYNDNLLWVIDNCVRQMTDAEYQQYVAQNPSSSVVKGYVKTTKGGVNVRSTPGSGNIIGRVDRDKVYAYYAAPIASGGYYFYFVNTEIGSGYLRSDVVKECDSAGTQTGTTAGGSTSSGSTSTGGYVAYTTLRPGSKGTDVKTMVTKLKELGYYTGDVTDEYTSGVTASVKSFQAAKKLTVDGIAGQKTLSALYGTQPSPSGTSSSGYTFYPVEKVDWFRGDIQKLWPRGSSFKVYDVYTGKVWTARRWAGGNHLDAEPLTASDTAVLCSIYGVKNASQIASNNMWQRRPLLVTIGNRTFAASLYGVPHNYPDGDTLPNNNYNGQLCIHFTNSMTHESKKVDSLHQEAIDYAYNHCPAGKK